MSWISRDLTHAVLLAGMAALAASRPRRPILHHAIDGARQYAAHRVLRQVRRACVPAELRAFDYCADTMSHAAATRVRARRPIAPQTNRAIRAAVKRVARSCHAELGTGLAAPRLGDIDRAGAPLFAAAAGPLRLPVRQAQQRRAQAAHPVRRRRRRRRAVSAGLARSSRAQYKNIH